MKPNSPESEYLPVSQGLQSDEDDHLVKQTVLEDGVALQNGKVMEKKLLPINASLEEGGGMKLEEEVIKKGPMSPLRKVCFVLSILQCALFIIAFGWLIPCMLPRHLESVTKNWDLQLKNPNITTSLEFAETEEKESFIIFGYQSPDNDSDHGFKGIETKTGTFKWNQALPLGPASIFCGDGTPIQASLSGHHLCLATDKGGKLAALELKTGKITWYMHTHPHNPKVDPSVLTQPITSMVCDLDDIADVFVSGNVNGSVILFVVSGSTGIVTSSFNLTFCAKLPTKTIAWVNKGTPQLSISCQNAKELETLYALSNLTLCSKQLHLTSPDYTNLHLFKRNERLIDVQALRVSDNHQEVIVVSSSGLVRMYNNFKESWEFNILAPFSFRDMVIGNFLNSSQSVAILMNDTEESQIIILDAASGQVLRNTSYMNGIIQSLHLVSSGDDQKESIIGRILSHSVDNTTETLVKEQFLLLQCHDSSVSFMTLDLPLMNTCKDGEDCSSANPIPSPTVRILNSNQGKTSYLIRSFKNENEQKELIQQIQSVNLKPFLSCTSCSC